MNATQRRLFISSAIMFLFFGLIPSMPPLHFNKDLFPGTRHMYSLHIQATCNGAWFNVFPWLYGGITGAVLKMGDGQVCGNHLANPFSHNAQLVSNIEMMLITCTLGDIIAWIIVLVSLCCKVKVEKSEIEKEKKQ